MHLDEQCLRLLYYLDKTNRAIDLVNTKVIDLILSLIFHLKSQHKSNSWNKKGLERLFDRNNTILILMNKLAVDKQYTVLIELFLKRLSSYKLDKSQTGVKAQIVPGNHIALFIESLYFLVIRKVYGDENEST